MYDYSCLPTLVPVMDRIFGYLSVKERVRCKSVCRAWRKEVERRERKKDTLVLHIGPYPWNMRWSQTNNQGLMKFENSFEVKNLTILDHPLTRSLMKKTKKLAFVHYHNVFNSTVSVFQSYLHYFEQCEEIEIRSLFIGTTPLAINLPKLKVLVIKDGGSAVQLVLNCPSLEVLSWDSAVHEIHFQNAKKLKRLLCFGWPSTVSLNGKFDALEYVNMFISGGVRVNDRLLNRMPKLKRLVLYSNNPQADLKIIRRQQKRFGLKNLEVLFNGCRDPVEMELDSDSSRLMITGSGIKHLHENYSRLVEDSPWKFCIDYSQLFNKFKILPNNFFKRFNEPFTLDITEVTSYPHLLGFLKSYPYLQKLRIHSNVKVGLVMDLMYSLQPSITLLSIVEDRPLDVLKIDLSFLRLLNLIQLSLQSTRLPIEFVRRAAAIRGPNLNSISFTRVPRVATGLLMICFHPQGPILIVNNRPQQYSNIEQLIAAMRSEPELRNFLI